MPVLPSFRVSPPSPLPAERPALSELFRHRAFVRFWYARLAGLLANQMLMVAVAWHMYDITGSAWDLGLVGLLQFVPALLLTLPAGQLVDRAHRGRIFAACMAVQTLVAVLLAFATQGGWATRGLILALSLLLGSVRAFQMPSQQALVPLLVPRHLLPRAIALSSIGTQGAVICGPALGGLVYMAGASAVYVLCTGLLAIACALTLGVRYTAPPQPPREGWRGMFRGVGFIWNREVLLGASSLDLFAVLMGGAVALLPIFARDILQAGPVALGLLRAAPAVGALAMSLVLVRHVGYKLLAAVGVFGLATLVFGLSESFWLSLAALAVTGAADEVSVVTRITLVQLETPDEMRGRVAAVNSVFIGASNQLGEFRAGAMATFLGPVGAVAFGGVATVMVALAWIRLFPGLARRDRMAP